MKDLSEIKDCYLAQPLAQRLGYLALNLARLRSLARETADPMLVDSILYESKFLIEWTAAEFEVETAAVLVELQVQLARWQLTLNQFWTNEDQRETFIETVGNWMKQVLRFSREASTDTALSA